MTVPFGCADTTCLPIQTPPTGLDYSRRRRPRRNFVQDRPGRGNLTLVSPADPDPPPASRAARADAPMADGDGWGAALVRHGRWLRRVLLTRLGEPQAVEDVMQDVSLAAAAARPAPPAEAAAAWLYRVAVRQALLHRRKAGRRRRMLGRFADPGAVAPVPTPPEPLGWLLSAERDALVRAALARLPRRDADL